EAIEGVLHISAVVPEAGAKTAAIQLKSFNIRAKDVQIDLIQGVQLGQGPGAGEGGKQVGQRRAGIGAEAAFGKGHAGQERDHALSFDAKTPEVSKTSEVFRK